MNIIESSNIDHWTPGKNCSSLRQDNDDCAEGQADEDAIQEMMAEISTLEETDEHDDQKDTSEDDTVWWIAGVHG